VVAKKENKKQTMFSTILRLIQDRPPYTRAILPTTATLGNENVPKIITNNTTSLFLKPQSAFWW